MATGPETTKKDATKMVDEFAEAIKDPTKMVDEVAKAIKQFNLPGVDVEFARRQPEEEPGSSHQCQPDRLPRSADGRQAAGRDPAGGDEGSLNGGRTRCRRRVHPGK